MLNKFYGAFDHGFGLHLVVDGDEWSDVECPSYIRACTIIKLLTPKENDMDVWGKKWSLRSSVINKLVVRLNEGTISEDDAIKIIERLNKGEHYGT